MLLGHIDLVSRRLVRGWAADTDRPHATIDVAVFADGRLLGVASADRARNDLKEVAAIGSGLHGIEYPFDHPLDADKHHEIVVRFVDGGRLLGQWLLPPEPVASADTPPAVTAAPGAPAGGTRAGASALSLVGFVDSCTRDAVKGWAASTEHPDEIVDVAIHVNGRKVAELHCDAPRDDVARTGRYGDGSRGFAHAFVPPLAANAETRVSVRFARTGMALTNGEQVLARQPDAQGAEAPRPVPSDTPSDRPTTGATPASATGQHRRIGHVDVVSRAWVAGWAADLDEPDTELKVGISVDGRELAVVTADIPRNDLRALGRYGAGRHGFAVRFDRFLTTHRSHRVGVYIARSGEALDGGQWLLEPIDVDAIDREIAAAMPGALTPVLLTHVPRSGSTFVMDVLSQHPRVSIARHYPHEVKVATYYANAARAMCQAAELNDAESPTEFMRRTDGIGRNPFNHFNFDDVFTDPRVSEYFFRGFAPNATRAAYRSIVQQYYKCIAMDGRKTPTHFVEKCELNVALRRNLQELFPELREIVLIRDLRDVYCSYRKYFSGPDPEFARGVIGNSAAYLTDLARRSHPSAIFVKYEDCIQDPAGFFRGVYEFLGLEDFSPPVNQSDDALFDRHATSESPAASIGRWRHELSPDEVATLADACGEFFRVFGYDAPAPAVAGPAADDHPIDPAAEPGDAAPTAPIEACAAGPADATAGGMQEAPAEPGR